MTTLFGGGSASHEFTAECDLTATRLATLMAALREFPAIRFKAAKNADGAVAAGVGFALFTTLFCSGGNTVRFMRAGMVHVTSLTPGSEWQP